ncbi:PREDICTED: uncharacterized protein LOC105461777 [Wasmannia auropunctata]|uniref:uncharacterized protein LOC105461777 n=1 Tax=Wasmannia auropunctata TaxID=64793 RepID=UPI0005F09F29|nr:PREDICTED: uncharacterized protein LOC105461777 [Wasmannia auropunctata]
MDNNMVVYSLEQLSTICHSVHKNKSTDESVYIFITRLQSILKQKSSFVISLGVCTSNRLATTTTPAFPRNVPSRSTFHSGQNRAQRNHTQGHTQTQDTNAISPLARPSFFSKLSSKFSKR